MKKSVLVVSDLHVGSSVGLLPPNYVDTNQNVQMLSPAQQYLWDNYINILDGLVAQGRQPDLIVGNGDMIDGRQRKNEGIGLTLLPLEDQMNAAANALYEIQNRFPNTSFRFVEGTPYHEAPEQVRALAKIFTPFPPHMTYRLQVGKAFVQFHHEVGFSSTITGAKSAQLEKAINENLIATALHDWRDYHILIRSHVHYFRAVAMKNHICISTPCFQMQNRYSTKAGPARNIPDLGMLWLEIDDSMLERGMCPVGYEELLFPYPEPEADNPFAEEAADEAVV